MLLPSGLFPHGFQTTVLQTGPHRALEPLCRLPTALFLLQWVQPWDCESAKQGQGTSETWEWFLQVAQLGAGQCHLLTRASVYYRRGPRSRL